MKIESLTAEQEARLDEFATRWIDIGLSTDPVDRDGAADAIARIYRQADLPVPPVEYRSHPEKEHLSAMYWNNFSAGSLGFYQFFDEVVGLEETAEMRPFFDLARVCGPVAFYDEVAIVYERPVEMRFDDMDRLHSETGPAVRYSDGFSVYCWHGVNIPGEWLTNPPSPADALRWENIEERRAACEIIGWDRILSELSAVVIDEDEDPMVGTLVEVDIPDVGRERFLRVVCGTGRRFALPVPPDMKTALDANSWTYGIDGDTLRQLEVRT